MALMRHLKLAGLAAVLVTLVGCATVGRCLLDACPAQDSGRGLDR